MSEFSEFAWGTAEVKRDLDISLQTANSSLSPDVALAALRALVLARPDAGTLQTDDEFLMRFLRARKLCVKDALEVYENYFRFLHRNRELCFGLKIEDAEIKQALEDGLPGVLQRRDSRGRRIMVLFAAQWDPSRYSISAIHKALYLSLDLLLQDCVVRERGLILVIDWSQFSFQQCSKLQPAALREIAEGLEYCYPVRFKSIHCVAQPWYIEAAVSLLKPFLRGTSRGKIFSHGNNLSSLHQIFSREILPAELGGEQGPYQSSLWIDNLIRASHDTPDRNQSID
ncbi:clavesin-2-like [Daphnia pulex]|uniref:clavesin-2-like n=1 Tax=Daphnia pulex TaxID=6669 RepID=UPI001EDD04E3|nr:clavesin-2-like [Daphnia pulex]